eukprot:CAMPEP_0119301508 /NCGR_PEP_ID=MMETSP1333-20130426/3279_1 /TAXON_ID=418940 /ORGANISM="Scyphosphaera apsteinii, Strain RCC1455" /LENGTH=145 /DNA_ID=CAMNT_0007303605 /DNA_START=88 /DNA_END=526 /DNA_ORIENTATION=+
MTNMIFGNLSFWHRGIHAKKKPLYLLRVLQGPNLRSAEWAMCFVAYGGGGGGGGGVCVCGGEGGGLTMSRKSVPCNSKTPSMLLNTVPMHSPESTAGQSRCLSLLWWSTDSAQVIMPYKPINAGQNEYHAEAKLVPTPTAFFLIS